ncbi:hypothetical protein PHMEG_0008192 [Phytophthora megakarya]|uniref:Uncharacterized protein n=1 Tax=Phytophthora megakarya TaxID=4795 RepID=A0A225WLT5_9STRA|nr:hypothetical protein PHMEG_0008192 [Phytophthora megakarya]
MPKPPTGLSNDHRYVRSGRTVRGKDGVDYFMDSAAGIRQTVRMSVLWRSGWISISAIFSGYRDIINWIEYSTAWGHFASCDVCYTTSCDYSTSSQVDGEAEFNTYDSDQFLAALARHEGSNEAEDDDPNICGSECEEDEPDDVETDQQLQEVMNVEIDEEHEALSASECEFDDNEVFETIANEAWSPRDDANVNPDFITDDELKAIADAWIVYDQDHSSEFQVDSARDLYDGRWGPTQSARAFAESPLGMFYYFMPKSGSSDVKLATPTAASNR